ncbi:MAG: hypothetical protein Q7S58_05120 [Candidatus Binatus sp.]|uniref:hypothetical protein n=1 Tax=Candidatus Binatus sp. TaxID=2811406 RepID=UPI00271D1000|nr:hypothetical protein [Candidatus Binatus sp.]MDO8431774.1 hypothetical protein [Candidatus Binatus sp.]
MSDFKVTLVGGKGIAAKIASFSADMRKEIARDVHAAQILLQRTATRILKQRTAGRGTGRLRAFIIEDIVEREHEVTGRVGSPEKYAEIQERGGDIHAKNAANLTIPLEAFMTGRHVARGSAHDLIGTPGKYGYTGTFFKSGILFGTQGKGKNEKSVPLFLLRPSVNIPGRPYMEPALAEVTPIAERNIATGLERLLMKRR